MTYIYSKERGLKMKTWDDIPEDMKEDLTTWYNQGCFLGEEDKNLLNKLYWNGTFNSWECANCGVMCYEGQPDDWGNFQGCHNTEHIGELCTDCTMQYLELKRYAMNNF